MHWIDKAAFGLVALAVVLRVGFGWSLAWAVSPVWIPALMLVGAAFIVWWALRKPDRHEPRTRAHYQSVTKIGDSAIPPN